MNSPPRTNKGHFPPGVSGNPQGRPKSESTALRERLSTDAEDIIQTVIQSAKEGDMTAAKIVLDRILPTLKPTASLVAIDIPGEQSPIDYARAILAAAASGQVPADTAVQLIQATTNLTRIIEADEMKDRIEALERILKPAPTKPKK